MMMLEAKRISLWAGTAQLLKEVSLGVGKRELLALIGPSGSGKSTLMRVFNRLCDLDRTLRVEGEALFEGKNIFARGTDVASLRREVGMVFQRPAVFPSSIYENVAYGPKIWGERRRARLDELVERSLRNAFLWEEVSTRLHADARALSGGQQQRLCIARALSVGPKVLLMDEPTSALDPVSTLKVEELMRSLKRSMPLVVVTHNLAQAGRVSDRVAFLMGGELVCEGETKTLFESPPPVLRRFMEGG